MERLRHAVLILVLAGALFVGGCGPKVVAKLNGAPITQEEFMQALENGIGLAEGPSAGRRVLDTLLVRRLVEKAAQEKGITVSDEEAKKALEEIKLSIKSSPRFTTFEDFYKQSGITEAYLADQAKYNLLLGKMVVTEQEAEQYFKERSAEFDKVKQLTFYQMFLPTKEAAEAARKEVVEGKADFSALAKQKSLKEARYPLPPGGITVTVPEGSVSDPDPNFGEILFSMKPGETSQPLMLRLPVMRSRGETSKEKFTIWRLLHVASITPAEKATFEKSKWEVMRVVFSRKVATGEVRQYLMSLKARARLDIIDPNYAPLGEEYKKLAKEIPEFKPPKPPAPGEMPPQPQAPQAPQSPP